MCLKEIFDKLVTDWIWGFVERAESKKMTCMKLVNWENDEAIHVNIKIKKSFMDLANKNLYSAYSKIWEDLENKIKFNIKYISFGWQQIILTGLMHGQK